MSSIKGLINVSFGKGGMSSLYLDIFLSTLGLFFYMLKFKRTYIRVKICYVFF